MSHGWTYAYWASSVDGDRSLAPSHKRNWAMAGLFAEAWMRQIANRIEYFP